MKFLSVRMEYQLPPNQQQQSLQIGQPPGTPTSLVSPSHLQLLQNVHQQQQQQQQQTILNSMQPPSTPLPSLSSLPLQVVHNLPHLLNGVTNVTGGSPIGGGGGTTVSTTGSNTTNSNIVNNLVTNNSLIAAAAVAHSINLSNNNNNSNSVNNSNSNNSNNSSSQSNNSNNSNNHITLPPPSQILHHHLHHMTNNNNNNNNNSNSNSNNNNNSNSIHNNHNNNNNIVNNNNTNNNINNSLNGLTDDANRWTQFQVQQLWRHHASYLNGNKSSNSKDICGDDKFKEDGDPWNVEAQAAFLGPNLWDKTLPYDADLKVTQYADLDEFLSENNIPDGLPGTHLGHAAGLGHRSDSLVHSAGLSLGLGHVTKRERSPSPSDCVSPDTINPPSPAESTFSFASSGRDFDPRTRAFSDEELKPQPMIKKSRKQFVPDELKDDKYWARRRKNNIAAKRSRDARRQKENQIAMRARYLEKENATLHQEVEQLKQENMDLRARLAKYQEV